jgi:hypothetical protein
MSCAALVTVHSSMALYHDIDKYLPKLGIKVINSLSYFEFYNLLGFTSYSLYFLVNM